MEASLVRPHPIDVHVGSRLRQRRVLLGVSQAELAKSVGMVRGRMHKHELGTSRISSSRLFELATVLGVPVSYFFDGMAADVARGRHRDRWPGPEASEAKILFKREAMRLVEAYFKVGSSKVRRNIHSVVLALASRA